MGLHEIKFDGAIPDQNQTSTILVWFLVDFRCSKWLNNKSKMFYQKYLRLKIICQSTYSLRYEYYFFLFSEISSIFSFDIVQFHELISVWKNKYFMKNKAFANFITKS